MDGTGKLEIRWIQGFTNNNIEFVDNKTICFPCGNHICFLNLETKMRSVFQSPCRGIGALTANGNRGIFAFSEQKFSPSIFVYNFPDFQLKNELKGTAQLDYTSLTFSNVGPFLACCASFPDYFITVWNWEKAEPICTEPQAGKDVISLVFNPLNCLQLCALGTASLTVWNIENSGLCHVLKPRKIKLPETDWSDERLASTSHNFSNNLPFVASKPPLAISGLKKTSSTRATLTPSAICWTTTLELYVGCKEGFLLLVDPQSLSVSVLFNPTIDDALPELKKSHFQALTLHQNGLIAVGKENVVHCLEIRGTQINIKQSWQLEGPATNGIHSPDNETILLSSNTGQIYMLNPIHSDKIVTILDVRSGNFLTAAFLHSDRNICVSLRNSGELQLWSSNGTCMKSLPLQIEVTSLACCPIALYAVVGTVSGNVLFIDLNNEEQPRLVHQIQLYHTAVDQLVLDQSGHYLLTGGSDSHIYVLHAKPSMGFSVIGYTVIPGRILSLCTQYFSDVEEVKVLALCTKQGGKSEDGDLLTVFSLPVRNLAGPDCVDRHGCLSAHVLKVFRYKVPHPLTSCVLGVSQVFAYCHRKKILQRFQLPKDTGGISSQQVIQLKPKQEVKGHQLGPTSLLLSPNCLWLASVGRDGLLRVRLTAAMERYIELQCHSCRLGGVQSVSFSTDGHTILTTGFKDGSLVCTNLRIKGVDAGKINDATQHSQSVALSLKNILRTENPFLIDLPTWGQEFPGDSGKKDENEVRGISVDVTEQDETYNSLLWAPPAHPTWLESRHEAVVKEDNEKYFESKKNLKETIRELRNTIQKMLRENENLPEEQFNLDVEEQRRFEAMVEQEIARVRAEIKQDIVEKCYLRDVLKRECWDSVMVKGRAIKAFNSELVVQNFPLKERTEKECEVLRRVQNMRKLEMAACTLSRVKEEEQGEGGCEAESDTLTGSYSAQLGCSNPYVYNQFSLKTKEQRINQIILLKDVIFRIQTVFNTEFEALHRRKVRELKSLRDKNKQIKAMILELDINQELWEPSLTDSEWPERLFTVDDSEIKAAKYLTPTQKEEERRKLEKQAHLAAQDGSRERALVEMMEGELEMKKVDILKMEISPPEFVLTKPNIHWNEEEKKVFREYENKVKDLNEEKEQYKMSLEIEIKKLQESCKDATEKFDETLALLLEKKVKCTIAIYQEELKTTCLADSVLTDEKMRNQELELRHNLEMMFKFKADTADEVKKGIDQVERFKQENICAVTEDRDFDINFGKEFFDVASQAIDSLFKLFKSRPRVQKMGIQTNNTSIPCVALALDASSQISKAMEELDDPKHMPEGLNSSIWERFCHVRRAKVESEQGVQAKAIALAEVQEFLRRRLHEDKAVLQELQILNEACESLSNKRNNNLINTTVQVRLKQGQVEVSSIDLTANTAETDVTLYHRSVADNLRGIIRNLAGEKVASMEGRKEVHKDIIQLEWKHRVLKKKIEDLTDKMKDIKMLRLSEEQQDLAHHSKMDERKCMHKKVADLEKTIAFIKTTHQRSIKQCNKKIAKFNEQAAMKAKKNAVLEQTLPDVQVTVAELRHIYEAADPEENEAAKILKHHQEVVQRRNLEDLARAQSEDLDVLWTEVERLTMRNFPSLDQLKYN
ncbi:cilia- and flagella-associated protein 43 [Melanotaenia boesemani]|uniref:cilia- and flagella-associated protein 43 n=1 Tax=Melanotaenia boesemani TaxID=1250792 RepID=UPI001C05B815|nr:cilia- and flagella-associated protein 43 [Melanotaenia boesemani]